MDFTIVIVGLLIGIGVPVRNKIIRERRRKRENRRFVCRAKKSCQPDLHNLTKKDE